MKYGKNQQAIMEARRRAGILELEAATKDVKPEAKLEEQEPKKADGDEW